MTKKNNTKLEQPKFLQNFYKELESLDGISTDDSPPRYWFSMGNYVLNKICSGSLTRGIPQGRILGIVGPSGAGKSYLAGNIIMNAQKQGAFCLVLDSEKALSVDYMQAIGIDTSTNYQYVDVTSFSQVIKVIQTFVNCYRAEYEDDVLNAPKVVILIDSIAQLMTDSEVNVYKKGEMRADQGLHSKTAKMVLKSIVADIKNLNISMIVTGHARMATQDEVMIKGEGQWICNEAFRFALSQIMLVTKLRLKNKEGTFSGVTIKATAFKSRFSQTWNSVRIDVPWVEGIDQYSGLLEAAESAGIVSRAGSWYTIDGDKFQSKDLAQHAETIITKFDSIKTLAVTNEAYSEVTTDD